MKQLVVRSYENAAVTLLIFFSLLAPNVGLAQSCEPLWADLAAFLRASSSNRVDVVITTNQAAHPLATVAVELDLTLAGGQRLVATGGRQYFNDRSVPPFSALHTDSLGFELRRGPPTLAVLVLESWDNGRIEVVPTCDGRILYGLIDGTSGILTATFRKRDAFDEELAFQHARSISRIPMRRTIVLTDRSNRLRWQLEWPRQLGQRSKPTAARIR